MFTWVKIDGNAATAAKYFEDDIDAEKRISRYYCNPSEIVPRWEGKLAAELGLEGEEILREDFQNLLAGNLPDGTSFLQREKSNRRAGFDFTCAASKSVSMMAINFDPRIREEYRSARKFAMAELEMRAATRLRIGGKDEDLQTGKMIFGVIEHDDSRTGDWHLHTHHIAINLTRDPDGKFTALSPAAITERTVLFTELFRNELARRLIGLGYKIVDSESGMEIEGISQEIIDRFSGGKKVLEEAAKKEEKRLGRKLNNRERAHLQHAGKSEKEKLSGIEFMQRNLAKLSPAEIEHLQSLVPTKGVETPEDDDAAADAAGAAVAHIFEKTVGAKTWVVALEALKFGRGKCSWSQIKSHLNKSGLIHDTKICTTPAHLEIEQNVLNFASETVGQHIPLARDFKPIGGLSGEQNRLLKTCLLSRDACTLVLGSPGAGKTMVLKYFLAAMNGTPAAVAAPTNSAVDVLREDGIPATTVHKLLHSETLPPIVIIDEASLLDAKSADALFARCKKDGSRIFLVGDPMQNKSVNAGQIFQVLIKYSRATRAKLEQIKRQQNPDYRSAIQSMTKRDFAKAEETFRGLDAIVEEEDFEKRNKVIASEYIKLAKSGTVCAVAHSWKQIDAATLEIRAALKTEGTLKGAEHEFQTLKTVDLTDAQKAREASWKKGALVQVIQGRPGLARGIVGEFQGCYRGKVRATIAGKTHLFSPAAVQCVQPRQTLVCEGEKLLMQWNALDCSGKKIVRGKIETVQQVDGKNILMKSGITVDTTLVRNWCTGFVITSMAAQGHTADAALVIKEATMDQKGYFVACSRGRKQIKIITENISLSREQTDLTATEIHERSVAPINPAKPVAQPGTKTIKHGLHSPIYRGTGAGPDSTSPGDNCVPTVRETMPGPGCAHPGKEDFSRVQKSL